MKKIAERIRFISNLLFDGDRKTLQQIYSEVKSLHQDINNKEWTHYFSCLMYKKDAGELKNYLPRSAYIEIIRDYYRGSGEHPILQNKNLFRELIVGKGYPTPHFLGKIKNGILKDDDDLQYTWTDSHIKEIVTNWIDKHQSVFIKQVDSEGGKDVFKVDADNTDNIKINLDAEYIIEAEIVQHDLLNKINPYCVNTLRVITVFKDGNVYIPDCFFRMGTGKSSVDNGSAGGIFIHYDIYDNKLGKVAYKLPKSGGQSFYKHPITGFVFKDQPLPYSKEVINLVKKVAREFTDKQLIGWDIAYTPNGPIILEGNDNPHIIMMKISARGLLSSDIYKDIFKSYYL